MRFEYQPYDTSAPEKGGEVHYWCPGCGQESYVQVLMQSPPPPHVWTMEQVSPLTITPSVRWFGHAHFNIVNGAVQMHADEPCKGRTDL